MSSEYTVLYPPRRGLQRASQDRGGGEFLGHASLLRGNGHHFAAEYTEAVDTGHQWAHRHIWYFLFGRVVVPQYWQAPHTALVNFRKYCWVSTDSRRVTVTSGDGVMRSTIFGLILRLSHFSNCPLFLVDKIYWLNFPLQKNMSPTIKNNLCTEKIYI